MLNWAGSLGKLPRLTFSNTDVVSPVYVGIRDRTMKKLWISLLGLACVASNGGLLRAQDDELPAPGQPAVEASAAAEGGAAVEANAVEADAVEADVDTAKAALAEQAPLPEPAPTPEAPAASVPAANVHAANRTETEELDHTGLPFRKIVGGTNFDDASRTTVRIVRDRRIVKTNRVGPGGVVQFSHVSPGLYTVLANGPEGFAVFGAYLGDQSAIDYDSVGLIPNRDFRVIQELIQSHLTGGGSNPTPSDAASEEIASYNGDFELAADGSVSGQILRPEANNSAPTPLANMFVGFVQNGSIVSEATTDANGQFTATGLQSGIYALVVSGTSGFAAFTTGVVAPESHVQARVRRLEMVSFLKAGGGLGVGTASSKDFPTFARTTGSSSQGDTSTATTTAATPGAGGGFGGGGAGGGGAGGGFGGGGLLGAVAGGAIGAGVAAALDDDDKKASPAAP